MERTSTTELGEGVHDSELFKSTATSLANLEYRDSMGQGISTFPDTNESHFGALGMDVSPCPLEYQPCTED